MYTSLTSALVTTAAGVLLLTAVLQTWRRSAAGAVRLLVAQGLALAMLVVALGIVRGDAELLWVAALVAVVKAGVLPWALSRTATGRLVDREATARPALGLLGATVLTMFAYAVGDSLRGVDQTPGGRALPAAVALVLIGFWTLLTRHAALSQLVGFVVLDNGIAMVAFLTSDGLPITVELGATLDVLLVVVILRALTSRMRDTHGGTSVGELSELRD
jgi:hydrogenase-4 component E